MARIGENVDVSPCERLVIDPVAAFTSRLHLGEFARSPEKITSVSGH